jgi:hypothetical protein
MQSQLLRPQKKEISFSGRLSYSWEVRAWNTIRLKKELVNEFPQLKERRSAFGYKTIFYHDYDKLERFIRKLRRDGEALPILVWLIKEKTN